MIHGPMVTLSNPQLGTGCQRFAEVGFGRLHCLQGLFALGQMRGYGGSQCASSAVCVARVHAGRLENVCSLTVKE